MATTDNKVLTGAGVEQLSQLVKNAIAQGGGGTEYTTKNGIQITEDDVIQNSFNPYDNWLLNALFNYSVYGQGPIGGAKGSTGVVSAPERTSLSHCQTAFNQGYCGMDLPYYGTITKADAYTAGFRYALAVQDNASPDWDSGYQYPQALQEGQSGAITDPTKYDNGILLRATYSNQPCLVWVNKLPYRLLATIPSKIYYKDSQIGNAGLASASGSDLSTILRNIGTAITEAKALATTETAGRVIPDGTTITIDSNGVISSQGGGSSLPSDPVVDGSYKLVNTVATVEGTQTATQSWEKNPVFTNGLTESDGTVSRDETYSVDKLIDRMLQSGSAANPSVDGLFKATTQAEFWQGIQSGKWFIRNDGLVFSQQMVSDLANDYGITQYQAYINYGSRQSGTITKDWTPSPTWFPVLVKRTDTYIVSFPYGTMNYPAIPWGQIPVYYDNATGKWLQDWVVEFKDGIAARIADTLVSTDTAPTKNNTINWVYK